MRVVRLYENAGHVGPQSPQVPQTFNVPLYGIQEMLFVIQGRLLARVFVLNPERSEGFKGTYETQNNFAVERNTNFHQEKVFNQKCF